MESPPAILRDFCLDEEKDSRRCRCLFPLIRFVLPGFHRFLLSWKHPAEILILIGPPGLPAPVRPAGAHGVTRCSSDGDPQNPQLARRILMVIQILLELAAGSHLTRDMIFSSLQNGLSRYYLSRYFCWLCSFVSIRKVFPFYSRHRKAYANKCFKLKEASRLGPRPEKPIEIYEFESCFSCPRIIGCKKPSVALFAERFSHHFILCILDLDVLFYPCPRNGPNFIPKVINQIIMDNVGFQENACLVGLILVVINFAVLDRPREVRMQAAFFLQKLCQSSNLTLQMFIACRGIPVLVGFLEADYAKYREMVHLAIDCMWHVFKLQHSVPRNDFCRIAAKNGILLRLVNTLQSLNEAARLASVQNGAAARPRSGPFELELTSIFASNFNSFQLIGPFHPFCSFSFSYDVIS
ncbi:hypothetical protein KSP40_PGU000819 [Platanthera guangdongensis]|uniref:Uncharacterized protein n=1 Tax=Platanthera guangdongensis TaxID=2320717 RepID=A0ABR2MCE6_9ASPA